MKKFRLEYYFIEHFEFKCEIEAPDMESAKEIAEELNDRLRGCKGHYVFEVTESAS